jgi:hypothetical protein
MDDRLDFLSSWNTQSSDSRRLCFLRLVIKSWFLFKMSVSVRRDGMLWPLESPHEHHESIFNTSGWCLAPISSASFFPWNHFQVSSDSMPAPNYEFLRGSADKEKWRWIGDVINQRLPRQPCHWLEFLLASIIPLGYSKTSGIDLSQFARHSNTITEVVWATYSSTVNSQKMKADSDCANTGK